MKKKAMYACILLILLIITVACSNNQNINRSSESKGNVELIISAAVSLKDSLDEIQRSYKEEHPEVTLKFNFGASGSLQQQITNGAPVDLFFSAAKDKFDILVEEGIIAKEDGLDLLGNELVLVVPEVSNAIKSFEALTNAEVGQISIGTPETVPAGKYSKESLKKMDIWNVIEPKVVYAKDVRQVLSYVESGNVDAGIVYKTDALLSDKAKIVAAADQSTHTPIIYPVGIIKNSAQYDAAKKFYEYVQSEDAIKVFEKYGFIIR
ncbi:molybdate ABC transporter substrate-binding protein [Sporosarcina highlanderae]|uniref:Molybdate ABC transporter substrate-binding protein n=1 Tax=Sporosarcina highlanderae TaxID=3035916 RepID=A0ABT8JU52_9BACL|nr:molybdate ABC transporter substrate-binding protein [Sporosarcina highlanderae]MDN4608422.1 molybdate ABC transporter substrate-binding protein [Sporosarcina highlanderae]